MDHSQRPVWGTSKVVLLGLFLMAVAWLADAALDTVFEKESFLHQALAPDLHELSIRLLFIGTQLAFIVFIARLLTRYQKLEQAQFFTSLRAQTEKEKSEAILEALGDGISIQDTDLKILYQNRAHQQIMGDRRGEFCYRAYQRREDVCPDCHLMRSFNDGRTHVQEATAPTGKERKHFEIISTPLFGPSGEIIAGIEAVRDTTERRRIEDQLRAQLEAMEGSIDGIAILDADGIYSYLNLAHARINGYHSAEELVGTSWRGLYAEQELKRFDTTIMPAFKKNGHWRGEAVGRRRDGSSFPQEISLTATAGDGIVCVVRDISERKQAEESIRQMNSALQQRAGELEAFSYSLSHDVHSYLTRISMAAQALESLPGEPPGAEATLCLQTILGACDGMETLIDAMLELARLDRQDLHREEVDLTALGRELAEELVKAEPHRRFRFAIAEDLNAAGDPHLLGAALGNLLGNAAKYSCHREISEISLSSTTRHGRRVFAVGDNGVGFDMAESHDLFRPFQRLGTGRDYPGHGIGLATVQRIIHRHGGEIWAESAPDRGAIFFFTLPDPEGSG